jgi:probable HAF family extracellular repeat protein
MNHLVNATTLAAIAIFNLASADAAPTASFIPLGDFPGGNYYSEASDISSDGSVVAGSSDPANIDAEAFRWTEQTGLFGLGTSLSVRGTAGGAISGDGSVLAGNIFDSYPNRSVFLWTASAGMSRLQGAQFDTADGLSYDGKVLVGRLRSASGGYHAYRWTEQTGAIDLGTLPITVRSGESDVNDVSADGSIVVGTSQTESGRFRAFRWSEPSGMIPLSDFLPGGQSVAFAVSDDKSVIVGSAFVTLGSFFDEAVMWKSSGEASVLGDLPGGVRSSSAEGVSGNGKIVVGVSTSDRGLEAFRWTEKSGMRTVQSILKELGVDTPGWRLESARAISADGSVITGRAVNPNGRAEAYVVQIPPSYVPEPSCEVLAVLAVALVSYRKGQG